MKKFYALAAAAAVCLSASAFNFQDAKFEKQLGELHQLGKVQKVDVPFTPSVDQASRADEFDVSALDCLLYYDYFDSFDDAGKFVGRLYATPQTYTIKATGDVVFDNFLGYSVFAPVGFYDKYEGLMTMEMGQKLLSSGGYDYVLAAINLEAEDEDDDLVTTGEIEFEMYGNAMQVPTNYLLGILVMQGGVSKGWQALCIDAMWIESNATVSYTCAANNNTYNVSQRCYTEASVKNQTLYLTGLNRVNSCLVCPFEVSGYDVVADEVVVEYSQSTSTGDDTGDYYLCAFFQEDGKNVYSHTLTGTISEDLTELTFDTNWGCMSEASYWYGECTPATYVFDEVLPADLCGIQGVAADTVDANAPVEYFNLQGVRVATPEAGQLLIKRQGSKVAKVVVR